VADVQGENGEAGEDGMTNPAFGRLLYTDCLPGTGRGSGGGFQVQAQSPDVDSKLAAFAVGWLLYEAQNAWIAERRPVGDFPAGFAHSSADGYYGTAQSRYVGQEASGGRQGNHLADCLLTSDPEPYGTIRPAQLWQSSPLWRDKAWDTIDCPPFDGDLAPGPLTLDEITDWVRKDDGKRGPALARLLSVLEDPDGKRVAIVSADADEAMRWIAAATLLLPQRQALQVTFKVFSAAPLRALQRVVGAPPDIFPELRPGGGSGMFIVDTATGTSDEATVTERAGFLVGRLTGDDDPYDVVDAADLADELSARAWPQDIAALHVAWTLTRPDDEVTVPDTLFRWLQQAAKEQLTEHGPVLAETLLASGPPPDVQVLQWLDARVTAGELEFDHEAIRARLLDAEIAKILAGERPTAEVLPKITLSEQADRDAESALTSALLRTSDDELATLEVDRLLRLAYRHGMTLEPLSPPLREMVNRFAVAWVDSSVRRNPDGWALREYIIAGVQDVLQDRFVQDPTSQAVRETLSRFVPYLSGIDPTSPLYWPLQAAAVKSLQPERQADLVRELLAASTRLREDHGPDFAQADVDFQQALLDWDAAGEQVAVAILIEHPPSRVLRQISDRATRWLADHASHPDEDLLKVLRGLGGRSRAGLPSRLAEIGDSDDKITEFISVATSAELPPSRVVALAETFRDIDQAVLVIRMAEILDVLLRDVNLAGPVYANLPKDNRSGRPASELRKLLIERFSAVTAFEDQVRWAIRCFYIQTYNRMSSRRIARMCEVLLEFQVVVIRARGAKEADKWRTEVRRRLARDDLRDQWDKIIPPSNLRTMRS
jgi:hypothetical protein